MVGTPQKREGARVLKAHRIPERRSVVLLGIARAGMRYQVRPKPQDHLAPQIQALSAEHPRWGQNRIWALLRRANVVVNHKAVGRLWQKLGLQLTRRPRRNKIRTGEVVPQLAERPNHVWTYDWSWPRSSPSGAHPGSSAATTGRNSSVAMSPCG